MTITTRYLITTIPQMDGGTRILYAYTARDAREARREISHEPAMIDHIHVDEIVDVYADGTRERRVQS